MSSQPFQSCSRHVTRIATLTVVILTAMSAAAAGAKRNWKLPPETARFRPGPGAELATGQCLLCHSADYIATQPPLDRAGWQASVQKMREKYGAPITTNSVPALVDYLVKTYGKPAAR